ncbi:MULTISPECIES: hypothetical protein [unclassified Streptomyces]|nr:MULTISPECIES: hypothetical protein [unclassified Streptomyces]
MIKNPTTNSASSPKANATTFIVFTVFLFPRSEAPASLRDRLRQ